MPLKIYKRPGSPYWQCSGTVLGTNVPRHSLGVTDCAEAEHKRITLENKIRQEAIFGKESEATFDDACVRYIKDRAAPLRTQMNRNLQVILKEAGHWKLREITPAMVRSLAVKLFPDCKPQSRNANAITPISAVLGHAHQCGLCGPIRIKRFKIVDERIANPADSDWIDAFMRHAPLRIAAFELFCFTTGARPQEACNLRPEHLRLDESIARGGITKNGKRREYELVPELVSMLRALEPRQVMYGPHKGEWRVFGYGSHRGIMAQWRKICEEAGIEYHTRYEAGRHAHFTETVVNKKLDVVTAGKLGNCTPAVLLRRYAHAGATAKAAMDIFGTRSTKPAQQKRGKLKTVGES